MFFLFLMLYFGAKGQSTIWFEDFSSNSDNDIVGNDNNLPAGSDWTNTCPSCALTSEFRVESGEMRVENTDEIVTWTSETILIGDYSDVTASVDIDMDDNQFDATDCITIYYKLDGGTNTQFTTNGNLCDDGSDPTVASVSGLNGTTLQIIIEAITNETNEDLHFDNIRVTGNGITGPGGVSAPDGISNLQLWLVVDTNCYTDAGITAGTNASSIQQWNDLSNYDNHAIQTNASFKPTLATNQLNGFSTLQFDGSDDRILSSGLSTNSQATIFVVVQHTNLISNNDGIIHAAPSGQAFSASTTSKTIGMWTNTSTGNIWGRGVQSNLTSRSLPQNTSLSTSQFYIITQDYDGSNISQYVDGTLAGSISYNGTLSSWTDFGIGRQGGESLDGELAEIITHTTSANDAQKIIIENYLAAKYGLTLSSNDLYNEDNAGNGDFDFEVAGIGREDASNIHEVAQGTSIVRIGNPSSLGNGDYLIWGHDNGTLMATETVDIPSGIIARFDRVWRTSETGNVGSIDMAWDLSDFTVIASDLRLLIDTDNDGVFTDETPISGATDIGGGRYEFTGVNIADNNRFTLATANLTTPLPIELVNFNAILNNRIVDLTWITASETNNDYFTIQRSKSALDWDDVSTVQGAGNSSATIMYHEVDYAPYLGLSFYRLKQTDFDGNFTYSEVKSINLGVSELRVYPNPVTNTIIVTGSQASDLEDLKLFNAAGQNVSNHMTILSRGELELIIDVSNLESGIYFFVSKSNQVPINKQ